MGTGASNRYLQQASIWRNKKNTNTFLLKTAIIWILIVLFYEHQGKFVADDILKFYFFFFFFFFSEKTSLDISSESSAKQMIHMKCEDLFSLKNKKKK